MLTDAASLPALREAVHALHVLRLHAHVELPRRLAGLPRQLELELRRVLRHDTMRISVILTVNFRQSLRQAHSAWRSFYVCWSRSLIAPHRTLMCDSLGGDAHVATCTCQS